MPVSEVERRLVAKYLEETAPVTWEGLYWAVMGRPIPLDTGAEEDARALCGRLAEMIRPGERVGNARESAVASAGGPETGGPEPECGDEVAEAHSALCAAEPWPMCGDGTPLRLDEVVVRDGDDGLWDVVGVTHKSSAIIRRHGTGGKARFAKLSGLRHAAPAADGGTGGVEHPAHYAGGVECIDAMTQTQGRGAVRDFCACNAFKYLWRWRRKGGVGDVRKAKWYLDRFLEMEGDGDGE